MEHLGDSNVIRKIHMLERYIYIYIKVDLLSFKIHETSYC